MKIFVVILIALSSCLAIPASTGHRLSKKEVTTASESGSNLVETDISLAPGSNDTQKYPNKASDEEVTNQPLQEDVSATIVTTETQVPTTTESGSIQEQNFSAPFHHDEFKVRVLDLDQPTKPEDKKKSEVSIGLPANQAELQIVKAPKLYIGREPQVVISENPNFLSNSHYAVPKFTGPFYPFQDVPALSDDFSNSENIFGISDVYPIYPIEMPQEAGYYPIIGGGSGITPVIPDTGEISQEFLQPDVANSFQLTDEKLDHETDSITIEAIGKSGKTPKGSKVATQTNGGDGSSASSDEKSEVGEKSDSKTAKV